MDKKQLAEIISNLKPTDQISLEFSGELTRYSGQYKVVESKTGRGKGGSKILTIVNSRGDIHDTMVVKGTKKSIGTPISELIDSITLLDGNNAEVETINMVVPMVQPVIVPDREAATELKKCFEELLDCEPTLVNIGSSDKTLNGSWIVKDSKRSTGVGGQIVLYMVSEADPTVKRELWSYRHSGLIDQFEIIGTAKSVPTEITS